MEATVTRKRWRWIGYVLRKDATPSPKLQSTGPKRESGRNVVGRQNGEELRSENEDYEPELGHYPEAGQ